MQNLAMMVRAKLQREAGGGGSQNTARPPRERLEPPPLQLPTVTPLSPPLEVVTQAKKRPVHPTTGFCRSGAPPVEDDDDGGRGDDFSNMESGFCWLCAKQANYHLAEEFVLCFSCMRLVIRTCVISRLDTPERRRSDAVFVAKIRKLPKIEPTLPAEPLRTSETSVLQGKTIQYGGCRDTVSVEDPLQAHFAMRRAVTRHPTKQSTEERRSLPAESSAFLGDDLWHCPQCAVMNRGTERFCRACHFHHAGIIMCPLCRTTCRFGEGRVSRCSNTKELHIVWNCAACGIFNSVDGDRCYNCRQPFMWACSRCTAEQESCRTSEGLRVCSTCGAYNTPLEAMESHRAMMQRNSTMGADTGVEFGFNDAETIAEKARQAEIEKAKGRLALRLQQLGSLQVNKQVSDGNCLFRCLTNQLFGHAKNHMLLRRLVVDYMRQRAESYSVLFDGEAEWQEYLHHMQQNGVWGDELCLNAAARCFHVNIHVITSDVARWHLVFQHENLGTSGSIAVPPAQAAQKAGWATSAAKPFSPECNSICLFLLYMAPVHYDDMTPFLATEVLDVRQYLKEQLLAILADESSWHDVGTEIVQPPLRLSQSGAPGRHSRRLGEACRAGETQTSRSTLRRQQQQLQQEGWNQCAHTRASACMSQSLSLPGLQQGCSLGGQGRQEPKKQRERWRRKPEANEDVPNKHGDTQ
ncbi:hypothetical protein TraAM80_06569 [Trypanosoma rangeli]|uniref:OTU domain-containing protein n=1 Tax=Trypanosoma rangeli TaxID=5698 RepID=A0A3R7MGK1_TRYRA|nr:uncharacterized protein TraAM80_06569 [Trypanosoma rangeli]RNF02143.1 hypothetical protein TraAM80_06569 [Trypanosoma rangeli]|eukprot:RNF02143.1 hypothetical protein TraAM80_06569 [Trypanosoma rangeli]